MPTHKNDYSKWSQEEKDSFRRANRIKASYLFTKGTFGQNRYLIFIFSLVVFVISDEKVNQNTIFSYFTLAQGIALIPFYILVKRTDHYQHLRNAFIAYMLIWLVEIVLFGFPNELLAAYNTVQIGGGNTMKPSIKLLYREKNADRDVYEIFPFIYSGVKLFFGGVLFFNFRAYYRWAKLPQSMKERVM